MKSMMIFLGEKIFSDQNVAYRENHFPKIKNIFRDLENDQFFPVWLTLPNFFSENKNIGPDKISHDVAIAGAAYTEKKFNTDKFYSHCGGCAFKQCLDPLRKDSVWSRFTHECSLRPRHSLPRVAFSSMT